MLTVASILEFLEQLAPPGLAAEWDNVGFLLGERSTEVRRLMTCLSVTPASAAEAIQSAAQLIVTHHPILFRPVNRLTDAAPEGRMLLDLIRAGVAVYSPHTAFDNAPGGINEILAERLQLREVAPLRPQRGPREYKVVVFVPDADLARVSDALFAAGAGNIGQYSQCSFRLAGTGTFFGSEAAHPAVGQKGRREEVSEWRLEAICPENRLEEVRRAIHESHSYEEPAYDFYALQPKTSDQGDGRIGKLPRPTRLRELAQLCKGIFKTNLLQVVGDAERSVEKVAIVCGAGGTLLADVIGARADLFVTGELRFHDYLAAQAAGVALLLPGHYATERISVEALALRLQQQWPDLEIWASRREQDPVQWI
jgi:dinuclear metal center YbgI/SA1388 family protein